MSEYKVDIKTIDPIHEAQTTTEVVSSNTQIESDCNAIAFLNVGETAVKVLDIPLAAGDPLLSFLNDASTIERTPFRIVFTSEVGKTDRLIVIRKYLTKV